MKTSSQRIQSIKNKISSKRKRRAVIWTASVTVCTLLVLTVICSLPILGQNAPSINAYKNDEYFQIIQKINAKYPDNRYSIFDKINSFGVKNDAGSVAPSGPDADSSNKNEETTLNQVDGVIEADLLKRSKTHAFYLKNYYSKNAEPCLVVDVYGLDGFNTEMVTSYVIKPQEETSFSKYSAYIEGEMFLSDDATRLTVITNCINRFRVTYTVVVLLDVTNVRQITEINRVYVSGAYLSSRKTDGKILIVTNFNVDNDIVEYDNKQTYIPQCGDTLGGGYVPIDDIYVPKDCPKLSYTVLAFLDETTLEVDSQYAAFSYAFDVYVSRDYVFIVRNVQYGYDKQFEYGKEINDGTASVYVNVAEIVALKYTDGFKYVGCIGLDGSVRDRYSMDERDGILRVFTTVRHSYRYNNVNMADVKDDDVNASLYCVDLNTKDIIASVNRFAPDGDEVKSARFDGDKAYVCTAVRNTDPVYFFDLSNIYNITYTDTGTIPGFSVSLIKFGNKLLGIGQGSESSSLKVELYNESNGIVDSVAKFERLCGFSYEYKAHFVDEERGLVGLQIYDLTDNLTAGSPYVRHNKYLLLRYNADIKAFETVYLKEFDCAVDLVRSFYKDNGVYVFGSNGNIFIEL